MGIRSHFAIAQLITIHLRCSFEILLRVQALDGDQILRKFHKMKIFWKRISYLIEHRFVDIKNVECCVCHTMISFQSKCLWKSCVTRSIFSYLFKELGGTGSSWWLTTNGNPMRSLKKFSIQICVHDLWLMNVLNNTLTREMVTILLLRKGDLLLNLGQLINGIFLIGLLTWPKKKNFEFFFKCHK